MARVIVITSGKGGVGKTTTTSNIGMALAGLGNKVLLIDADVGCRMWLFDEHGCVLHGTGIMETWNRCT